MRVTATLTLLLLLLSTTAAAQTPAVTDRIAGGHGYYAFEPQNEVRQSRVSNVLFLDFCQAPNTCNLSPGPDNANANISSVLQRCANQPVTVEPFMHSEQMKQELIDCVRDVYAPYDVTIVTERPDGNTLHHRAIVAGKMSDLGCQDPFLGVAPANNDCSPRDNAISYSLANETTDMESLCWTVAQESAHSYGLVNHVGDARDPMTYLQVFRGRKYFRNLPMPCSESFFEPIQTMPCQCTGAFQNSHTMLSSRFGPGEPIEKATVAITTPSENDTVSENFFVSATASDKRQINSVELWVNDWRYTSVDGYSWQNRDDEYVLQAPDLPDGVQNIEVRGYNDLGVYGSATTTVTKGEPCTTADACFEGQECRNGGCYWPTPVAELGDECIRDENCVSQTCTELDGSKRCTKACSVGNDATCEEGFTCRDSDNGGVCWAQSGGGGICSGTNAGWAVLLVLTLGFAGVHRCDSRLQCR